MAEIEYVAVAEVGPLERQALMLVESIRLLPGVAGKSSITVISPRADRRPAATTLRQLDRLGAEYLPLSIESPCPYYGTSLKLAAMREVERRFGPPTLVMLDSDSLFLATPSFDLGPRAVALRPVDGKGMCTSGAGDPYDDYWRRFCTLCGVAYDELPWVHGTVDGKRVKASHNGGLVAANRGDGLYSTTFDFLCRAVTADLFPRSEAIAERASRRMGSGVVSLRARRIWGTAQAALSLAILKRGLVARILPPTYNVPCHRFADVVARHPEVATKSVHVHYHWLCDHDQMNASPLLDGRLAVPAAVATLLRRHLPLDRAPSIVRRLLRLFAIRLPARGLSGV